MIRLFAVYVRVTSHYVNNFTLRYVPIIDYLTLNKLQWKRPDSERERTKILLTYLIIYL